MFSLNNKLSPPLFSPKFPLWFCILSWAGEVHGQAWAKVGQSGWGLFCELRWALHWYKPIHLESTGTDPEIQASLLRKPFWLTLALPFCKRKFVQEMKSGWWDGWRKGHGGIGSHLCHSWDILSSENEQRPIFCLCLGLDGHTRIWLCVF